MKRILGILLAFCMSLSLPMTSFAQATGGTVTGTVRNQAGEVIAGARVTAINSGTNQKRLAETDQDGVYRLPALAIGTYEIAVESDSFVKAVRQLTLRVNEDARVDFQLIAAGSNEQVQVIATEGSITETSSSVLGLVIENKQILELPLNGRNFLQLGTLVANVSSTASLRGGAEGGILNGPFAVAGQRDRSLTFLIDGVDNNSQSNNLSAQVSLDSIQEFKMITNLGAAEFGNHSGGTINIVTKSGTNDFHFSAFEFFRTDKLNSANFFEKIEGRDPADFKLHQFGGTIGGPLIKDRTFFLGNVELQRLNVGNAQFATVPTAAQRAGIFRNPVTGQNVQLPVDPVSAEILHRYVPLPNSDSEYGNYFSAPEIDAHNNFAIVRVDHLVSGEGVLNARYLFSDTDTFNPTIFNVFGSTGNRAPTIPGFGSEDDFPTHNVSVAYTHTFSSSIINETRFGYNRVGGFQTPEDETVPSELGFEGVDTPTGLFDINIPGITRLGNVLPYPILQKMNNFHLVNSLSWLKGRHSMKLGGEARWTNREADSSREGAGTLIFSGSVSRISPLADFILGVPVAGVFVTRNITAPIRQLQTGLFWQDDYQVNKRLVLNYGLRYELSTVISSPGNKLINFSIERGFFTPGVDTDTGLYKGDHNDFAPRFGFALSLDDDGKTVVRGGYGIFYDALGHNAALIINGNDLNDQWRVLSFAPRGPGKLGGIFAPATLAPSPAATLTVYDEGIRTPYAQHFNLNLQRELWGNSVLSFGYVGTKTTKLTVNRNINQAVYIPGTNANGQPLSTSSNVTSRRPTQLYHLTDFPVDALTQIESSASAIYHSFQATFSRRFSRGLSALSSYTWSKSIDNATDPLGYAGDTGGPQNGNDLRSDRALSIFDIRHRFTLAVTYVLPFKGNRWVEGWQINTLATVQSGQPFTPILGFDPSLTGSTNVRPNFVPGAFIVNGGQITLNPDLPRDPVRGIPLALIPAPGEFGNLGRNSFIGPGYRNLDLSTIKEIRVKEKFRFQARFEVFNLFNTANLAQPERRLLDPFFGRSTRTQDVAGGVPGIGGGGPRVAQLAFKVIY